MADDASTARMPLPSRTTSAADERVLGCASKLFCQRGIAAVKMTDIAEASGMGVATLYRHFSTKSAIAVAVGTRMWEILVADCEKLVKGDAYLQLDGASRLECLLRSYCERYLFKPGFATFFEDLDRIVILGEVDEASVEEYTNVLGAAYPYYLEAYQLGCEDGSLARAVDFSVFYRSLAHALLSVAAKLQRGEVLPTDDFSQGAGELDCLVDMAIASLRLRG